MPRKELGEILLQADLVSEAQLAEALRLQRTFGERLASVLVRQNILTEKFAVTYLGRQLGVPSVDLSKQEIALGLLDLIPLEMCERRLVFPVKVDGARLLTAMADPLDKVLVSEIEFKTGARLAPAIALESSIKNAISEARRALKAGLNSITPHVQKLRPSGAPAATPSADAPAEPAAPAIVPLSPLEEKEMAVFETLAGTPLTLPAPPPTPPAHEPSLEETQTVLAVDDDAPTLSMLEALLRSKRYRVVMARTGREGQARLREVVPDLVILDGMLPEINGFELCRQIKSSERFRHIPVIMVSGVHKGWRFAADVKETYGADDYLEKPYDPKDLLRRVEALLTRNPQAPAVSETAARQHLKEGVAALKQERIEEAMASFRRGLAIDQFNDLLHYYLAMCHEKRDEVFESIDHYERSIQLNPDFYDAITALATLYQRQDFRRKSAEMWELALSATRDEALRARIKEHLLTLL